MHLLPRRERRFRSGARAATIVLSAPLANPAQAHSIVGARATLASSAEFRIAQLEADALSPMLARSRWWAQVVQEAVQTALDHDVPGNHIFDEEDVSSAQFDSDMEDENASASAERPVVVLKMARTGSTWLGNSLRNVAGLCTFHNEVTNIPVIYRGIAAANDTSCKQLTSFVQSRMQCKKHGVFGGITLNPFKFDVHSPLEQGSCWDDLREAIVKLKPRVIVLRRANVVAQAASDMKSMEIRALGLCGKPEDSWHLDRCGSAAQQHLIAPDPAKFLAVVREKNGTEYRLRDVARTIVGAGEKPLQLTMEDMLQGDKRLTLPDKVLKFLSVAGPNESHEVMTDISSFSLARLRAGTLQLRRSFLQKFAPQPSAMKHVLANYEEVYDHFVEYAPELVPLLTMSR